MVSQVESGNGWARILGKDYNFLKTCWIKETPWENVKQNLIFIHFFFLTFSFFFLYPFPLTSPPFIPLPYLCPFRKKVAPSPGRGNNWRKPNVVGSQARHLASSTRNWQSGVFRAAHLIEQEPEECNEASFNQIEGMAPAKPRSSELISPDKQSLGHSFPSWDERSSLHPTRIWNKKILLDTSNRFRTQSEWDLNLLCRCCDAVVFRRERCSWTVGGE